MHILVQQNLELCVYTYIREQGYAVIYAQNQNMKIVLQEHSEELDRELNLNS